MKLNIEFDYNTSWQLTLFNHSNCLHFKMLRLASETSILYYMRTGEINCHYLMTLFCSTQFKHASVLGPFQAFWPRKGLIKRQAAISADNVSDCLDTVGGPWVCTYLMVDFHPPATLVVQLPQPHLHTTTCSQVLTFASTFHFQTHTKHFVDMFLCNDMQS